MDKLRKLIWKLIGYPKQYQEVIEILEDMEPETVGVAMYPVGDFPIGVNIPTVGPQTYNFITYNERKAFIMGLELGTAMLGGQVKATGFDTQEEFDEMMENAHQMPRKDRMN